LSTLQRHLKNAGSVQIYDLCYREVSALACLVETASPFMTVKMPLRAQNFSFPKRTHFVFARPQLSIFMRIFFRETPDRTVNPLTPPEFFIDKNPVNS